MIGKFIGSPTHYKSNTSSLPNKSQLLFYAKRYDATTNRIADTVGQSERDQLPLQFATSNGTSDYVDTGISAPLNVGASGYIRIKLKHRTPASLPINSILLGQNHTKGIYCNYNNTGVITLYIANVPIATSAGTIVANTTYNIELIYNNGSKIINLNGLQVASGSGTLISDPTNLFLHKGSIVSDYCSGSTWDIEIYAGSSEATAQLIAYYPYPTKTGTSSAKWFDTSGNNRHATVTTSDVNAYCQSGYSYGSDWANLYGYSVIENLINNTPAVGNVDISFTGPDVDGYYTCTKLTASDSRSINLQVGNLRGLPQKTVIGLRFKIKALQGRQNRIDFGFYQTSWSGHYGYIESGPGVISLSGGYLTLTGASENEDTIVVVYKTNVTIGSGISNLFYPGGVPAGNIGDGCKIRDIQIIENIYQSFPYLPLPQTPPGYKPAQYSNPSLDALGNTLQYPGRAKYSIKPVQAVCATFAIGTSLAVTNTNGVAIAAGSSYVNAGTATVTIGTNSISYLTAGTVYNLRITSNGRTITIPFIEGSGTTAYGYDNLDGTYQCAITASDISAFWAGRQDTFFPGLQYGCSVGRWNPIGMVYTNDPTRTNKVTCKKANPIDASGFVVSGGATISVVNESLDSLQTALDNYDVNTDISTVCTSLKVYEVVLPSGSFVNIPGTTGNTNKHSMSAYVKQISGAYNVDFGLFGSRVRITSSIYKKIVSDNSTPSSSASQLVIHNTLSGECVVRFILLQLEEGTFSTPTIIGADTAATATEYNGQWPANPSVGLDCRGNPLTHQPGLINQSAQYQLPAAKQVIDAYPSAFTGSTPNNLTDTQLHTFGVGPRLFHGATKHNTALYSADQDAASQLKIGKVIK